MEVWLGVVGVPVFYLLSLCLDVLVAGYRVVWYSTLATTNFFVGYEPGFLLYLSFSSFLRLLGYL